MTEKSPELKVLGAISVCAGEACGWLVFEPDWVLVAFVSKLETEPDVWLVGLVGDGLGVWGCVEFILGLSPFVLK